jgi:serine/threonine protein kinase
LTPAGEPAIFQPDQIIDGKFQVRRVVASGGFSTVYKVYDEVLDRVTALKLFKNPDVSFEQ